MILKVQLSTQDIQKALTDFIGDQLDRDVEFSSALPELAALEICVKLGEARCKPRWVHEQMKDQEFQVEPAKESPLDSWDDEELDEDSGDSLPALSPEAQKVLKGELAPHDVRGGGSRKRSRRRNMRHLGGR